MQRQQPSVLSYIVAGLLIFAAALLAGGQPWGLVCMIAVAAQAYCDLRVGSLVSQVAPSLLWVVLFRATDNRELYFPFTIYLAAHVALLWAAKKLWLGALGGGFVLAVFIAVRISQDAPERVLAVELVAGGMILTSALAVYSLAQSNPILESCVVVVASLIAYCCLAI